MMYWNYDHMGGWGYVAMAASQIVFWALVIGGVVWAVRYLTRESRAAVGKPAASSAEQVLAERFASGEISEDEYRQRVSVLRDVAKPGEG